MLLICGPEGFDKFFEGKNEKDISTTVGSTVTALMFLSGFGMKGYVTGIVQFIAVLFILAGGFQAYKKLFWVTQAKVNTDD